MADHVLDSGVRTRVIEQAGVVDLEKPGKRDADIPQPRRGERAPDERGRPFADHTANRLFRQGRSSELDDQLVGGIREIAPRVDQGAVEIENNQAV